MTAWVNLHKDPIAETIKRAKRDMKRYPQLTRFGFTAERTGRGWYKHNGTMRKHVRWKWEDKAQGASWKYIKGNLGML